MKFNCEFCGHYTNSSATLVKRHQKYCKYNPKYKKCESCYYGGDDMSCYGRCQHPEKLRIDEEREIVGDSYKKVFACNDENSKWIDKRKMKKLEKKAPQPDDYMINTDSMWGYSHQCGVDEKIKDGVEELSELHDKYMKLSIFNKIYDWILKKIVG